MRGKSNMENRKNTQPTKIHSQRCHGQDPWIQIGSGPDGPISGNLPPHLQSEADLPFHMQGSASPSGEPICALSIECLLNESRLCFFSYSIFRQRL